MNWRSSAETMSLDIVRSFVIMGLLVAPCAGQSSTSSATPKSAKNPSQTAPSTKSAKPAQAEPDTEGPIKLTIGVFPIAAFGLKVMQQTGLDKEYKLNLAYTIYPTVTALYTGALAKDYMLGVSGWGTVASWAFQGHDWVNIYSGVYTSDHIVVRPDSTLRGFTDLRGKKIVSFGGPVGQSTINFRIIGMTQFGFDPAKDSQLMYLAGPLAAGLLEKGEVDAVLLNEPLVTPLLVAKKVRILHGINDLWRKQTGHDMLQLSIAVQGEVARNYPQTVRRFVKAYVEAGKRVIREPALQKQFSVAMLGEDIANKLSAAELQAFVRRAATYADRWDANYIKELKDLAKKGIELAGAEFMPGVPDKAFSLDYIQER